MGGRAKQPVLEPIQVYLDSSDYSKLSDANRALSDGEINALKWIQDAVSRGDIEVRYSIVHVIEACHRDVSSKQMAMARAALMKELSGDKVLLPFTEVVASEVEPREVRRGSGVARDDHGRWYPAINIGVEIRSNVRSLVSKEFMERGANRALRRAARGHLAKQSRRRALVDSVLRDQTGLESLCVVYGVPRRLAKTDIFKQMLDEDMSEMAIRKRVLSELFDVTHFVNDYIDRFEGTTLIRNVAYKIGSQLVASVMSLRESLRVLRIQDVKDAQSTIESAKEAWRAQFSRFPQEIVKRICEKQESEHGKGSTDRSGYHPGLDVMADLMYVWFSDAMGSGQAIGRQPTASDAGDLMHAFYAPYVDIWRGDRYASAIVKRVLRPGHTLVVSKIEDIPDAYRVARKSQVVV